MTFGNQLLEQLMVGKKQQLGRQQQLGQ